MDEDANSWIRRTKFSHTVCHRIDYSKLASVPLAIGPEERLRVKSRPTGVSSRAGETSTNKKIQRSPIAYNKQRSLSPIPQAELSDVFKEARSNQKRFSTPFPQRKEPEKGIRGKFSHRGYHEIKVSNSSSSNTSPFRTYASMKMHEKQKNKKESAWSKYFDHGGGKIMALESADEWEVDMSKLFLGLRFAHGAHSRLYHGIYKDEPVAVKIIRVPDEEENDSLASRLEKQFTREVMLLSRLHHENVIKFVAACKNPPVYFIITEYLSEGSLRAYLHKLERRSIPLEKLIGIALDVARGMEYVHSQGVIHRDVKPENILIDENFHMKIADFGIACDEAYCDTLSEDPGTYRWMAPEMIKRKPYGKKVDVYSFGLILWEMVAGTIPYDDMNPIQAAFAVVNKNLRPAIPKDCPPALQALIEQCWSLQPDKRPEFWQIVKVLEQFKFSLAHDGSLSLVQNPICQDHKKGLRHWIQKLGPAHQNSSIISKPKFA